LLLHLIECLKLFAKQGYLVLESGGPRLKIRRLRAICCIQICPVALNAFFDLLFALVDLAQGYALFTGVDGFELAVINGRCCINRP